MQIVHFSLRSKYARVTPKFINPGIFLKFILSCNIIVIKPTHKPLHTDSYWPALTSQNHHHHQARLPWPFLKQPPYLWHTSWIMAVPNRHIQMAMWAATAVQQTSQKDRGCKQLPIFFPSLNIKTKVCTHPMEVPHSNWLVCLHWPCRLFRPVKHVSLKSPFFLPHHKV